jgi:class 3 adenylate cyclase
MTETPDQLPSLRVRSGPDPGVSIVIAEPIVIGRDADVTIADHEISRRHARVRPDGPSLVIEDLGSANGTWVNGRRVEHAVLHNGDVLTLGRTTLEVVAPEALMARPEPSSSLLRPAGTAPSIRPRPIEGELRPITALFADVVGSTALGEQLDPDEISTLIGECVARMTRAVERFGGVVSTYSGDGIAAFFGLDTASAHDPELAAHAALAIISAIDAYSGEVDRIWRIADFSVRVGLNTGHAAVGALGSADRPNVALGDTTNVAARLQGVAEPGAIAVGPETAEHLRGRFLLEPLGDVQVKGRQAPVEAWRLLGALDRPTYPRYGRILGRAAELHTLRTLIDDACGGGGRVLFVVGEIGIGKTRLLAELDALAGHRAVVLQAFCAATPAMPPYGPFAAVLRAWAGADRIDSDTIVRAKLEARLESLDGAPPGLADGLVLLLGLSPGTPERGTGDPVAAFTAWLRAIARQQPLVLALDDIHYLERSSAVLALEVAALAMEVPLLFVSTLRPDHESQAWGVRTSARVAHPTRAQELTLRPLPDAEARELVRQIAPNTDPVVRDEVVRRSEGNPLFVEQLVRAVEEGTALPSHAPSVRTVATAQLLPPALASVFVGRIDRLPPEVRRVAQTAAAIGRTFGRDLLSRVVGPAAVEQAIPVLLEAAIISPRVPDPEPAWSFTHALLRDAALSTLPRSRRREIFHRVAGAFEESVGDASDQHLELLAYYYARSTDTAKALVYHERAARKARRVGADTEATGQLRRAAELAAELRDDDASRRIAAELE